LVIDIGAGGGAITAQLLDQGAQVIAVELHPGRAAALRRRFAGTPPRLCVLTRLRYGYLVVRSASSRTRRMRPPAR
jgi:hypothetical protein